MEATYICHWIKRRVMETTVIHLSDLYDTGTRMKKNYVSTSFELRTLHQALKLQYSERIENFKKNYSLIEK